MSIATNPIVESGADPWVIFLDGAYNYCYSRGDRICVRQSKNLAEIARGPEVVAWKPPPGRPYSKEIWAPELHAIGPRNYIYFAADDGENANHRMYVLESEGPDPRGPYRLRGRLSATTDRWAIDGTIGWLNGHLYFVWSGWEGVENTRQDLFIAPMSNPWTLFGERSCISVPEHAWEKLGPGWEDKGVPGGVNEGPQFLEKDGTIHILYSANGSWTDDYCLGQLTYAGGDPMSRRSWRKKNTPVFSSTDRVFGPGHASFVKSPEGQEDWIVYHAAKRKGSGWDRDIRTQRFTWDADNAPRFGRPLPPGVPIDTKPEE